MVTLSLTLGQGYEVLRAGDAPCDSRLLFQESVLAWAQCLWRWYPRDSLSYSYIWLVFTTAQQTGFSCTQLYRGSDIQLKHWLTGAAALTASSWGRLAYLVTGMIVDCWATPWVMRAMMHWAGFWLEMFKKKCEKCCERLHIWETCISYYYFAMFA